MGRILIRIGYNSSLGAWKSNITSSLRYVSYFLTRLTRGSIAQAKLFLLYIFNKYCMIRVNFA